MYLIRTVRSNPAVVLVLSNRPFRVLWLARTISVVGNSLGLLALLLFVAQQTSSGAAVALLMLVGDFAPALLSPFTAVFSDRFDRRWVMTGAELAQGAVISAIALLVPPLPALLALVGVRTTIGHVFDPASRSSVPQIVAVDDLEAANSAMGFGTHGLDLLGPVIGVLLLPLVHVRGLLLVDAATFVASALLLATLPALAPGSDADAGEDGGLFRNAAAGLRYLWSNRIVRVVFVGFLVVVAFNAVDDVGLVFLAHRNLHGSDAGASLLYAGSGLGLLIGFVVLSRWARLVPMLALVVIGFGVSSAGNLATGLSWALLVAFAMQTVRGIGLSLVEVGNNTMLQREVPSHMLGRVFGNLYGAIGGAAALSYVVGGILLDRVGARPVFIAAGAGGLLATLGMVLGLLRATAGRADAPAATVQEDGG